MPASRDAERTGACLTPATARLKRRLQCGHAKVAHKRPLLRCSKDRMLQRLQRLHEVPVAPTAAVPAGAGRSQCGQPCQADVCAQRARAAQGADALPRRARSFQGRRGEPARARAGSGGAGGHLRRHGRVAASGGGAAAGAPSSCAFCGTRAGCCPFWHGARRRLLKACGALHA